MATLQKFLHPSMTPFKYAKPRSKVKYPLELDAFTVMEKYLPQAVRHIHMSPRIAKTRELLGLFDEVAQDGSKTKWSLFQTHPNLANFVDEWLLYQTGIEQGSKIFHGKLARILTKLNNNMTFALLSWNLRTILIQPSAFRNTLTEIGPKYMLHGIKDLFSAAVDHKLWNHAFDKSNVLFGRAFDVSLQQAFDAVRGGRFGTIKTVVGKAGMKPLQWFDIATAWATWRGAYKKALAEGLGEFKAARYADDIVVKTQASGAPSDIAKIQRTPEGKLVTLLQTFVVNDWGFFMRDVLGVGNPRLNPKDTFGKLLKYVVATTLVNNIYENMGMSSPYGTPVKAALEKLEQGESELSAARAAGRELLEGLPMVGGAVRYGSTPFGPVMQTVGEVAGTVLSDKPFKAGQMTEWGGRIVGIPGTAQVSKATRRLGKGADVWESLVGKSTPPVVEKSRRGRSKPTRKRGRGRD